MGVLGKNKSVTNDAKVIDFDVGKNNDATNQGERIDRNETIDL